MVKIIQKFGFAACIAAVLCSGYGSVLCYGRDGHVAIESAFHNHCHHDEHEQGPAEHEHPAATVSNTCNPCEDIAVGYDMELARPHDMTQFASVNLNTRFSDIFIASGDVFDPQYNSYAFFTPLNTIRLLT